jgi:hypothetical protein
MRHAVQDGHYQNRGGDRPWQARWLPSKVAQTIDAWMGREQRIGGGRNGDSDDSDRANGKGQRHEIVD